MDNIQELLREHANHFTIYVVEQKFVVGQGFEFFKSFKGKPNYIDSDQNAKNLIGKIFSWIGKKIPVVGAMVKIAFDGLSPAGIVDVVIALSKLFMTQEHQAAGPNVIDPIIIQEGKVLKKYITQLVALHKSSILAPAIIILLQDNNFERAKALLSECPDGLYIKFIRNSGKTELDRIINTGATNIDGFINAFAHQCFSTCSNTRHDILLNEEWAADSKVKKYVPRLLKYRAELLCDEKNETLSELSNFITGLQNELDTENLSMNDRILMRNFLCISKIFRVFCNDRGGQDITEALSLAKELDNKILLAHVYKYAYFFPNKSIAEQNIYLEEAYKIFVENEMADNAIYCKNNRLVRQFDMDKISNRDFTDMVGEATSDVPGLVGMPHLFNNAGIAFMMTAQPDLALEYFEHGMDYAKSSERLVQKLAIMCNQLITKSYYHEKIEYSEIEKLLIQIFDGMVQYQKLPFISSRYVMNLLMISLRENPNWTKEFLQNYAILDLINQGLHNNTIGSGQLLMQLDFIDQKFPEFNFKSSYAIPKGIMQVTGKRKEFIEKSGLNPFYFCTWL